MPATLDRFSCDEARRAFLEHRAPFGIPEIAAAMARHDALALATAPEQPPPPPPKPKAPPTPTVGKPFNVGSLVNRGISVGFSATLSDEAARYALAHGVTFGEAVRALSQGGDLEQRYRDARNRWCADAIRLTE